jgi:acetolactate synthase-1/2/3 large subunit
VLAQYIGNSVSKGVKTLATHVDLDSGADAVAYFIEKFCFPKVFLVTGGACAFMVDAIGRNNNLDFVTFQHEQSAAMAADAIWRTNSQVGVTMATSGPGATNLITGIACSWFDSIPSLHITGQVNSNESSKYLGVNVRQAGFQETDIVSMVKPITKAAEYFDSVDKLVSELPELLKIALSDRKGPILVDIPMDVQKAKLTTNQKEKILNWSIDLETPKIGFTNISKEVDLLAQQIVEN